MTSAFGPLKNRFTALGERLDALSLRERGIIFFAGATLVYIAWQTLLMGPVSVRERNAEQRLQEVRRQLANIEQMGSASAAASDPLLAAAARNRSLQTRLAALDAELHRAAEGYIQPERMTELLRRVIDEQHGLKLVMLANLPVESLSQPPGAASAAAPGSAPGASVGEAGAKDVGPFLHPVELVVDGDYASVIAYLRALEGLPWRIHWQVLELRSGDSPVNRVRLKIGALSLSADWISL